MGNSRVFLSFQQSTDMDLAYREVRDRVERARRQFPSDVDKVYVFKDDVSGIPVTVLGVAVDPSVADYYNLLQKHIILPLERIDGVATVNVDGLLEKEIIIELDRDRTDASGLNIYDLAQELGGDFVIRDFVDEFLESGIIPLSLIRWEMTGNSDDVTLVTEDLPRS